MANPFDDPDEWAHSRRSPKNKLIILGLVVIIALSAIGVGPYAYFYLKSTTSNHCSSTGGTVTGFGVEEGSCVNLGVQITYQNDVFPRLNMLSQGYQPSCWLFCHGIIYSEK